MDIKDPSFEAFCQHYHSEQACADALYQARWPDGFRCGACGHSRHYRINTRRLPLFECVNCHRQTSLIAGTIMEGSSTPLTCWFQAFFLLSQPFGISSLRLSKILNVTYKTAWLISHKIRHAMQTNDRAELLSGNVQVEHGYYGSALFPDAKHPLLFAGSLLATDGQPLSIKIKQPDPEHVDNENRRILRSGVNSFIEDHTDGRRVAVYSSYDRMGRKFNDLKFLVNQWLNDTFNGIGAKHLQAYLDEFCFRINKRLNESPIFGPLLTWCASSTPLTYKVLTSDKPVLPVPWKLFGSKPRWKYSHMRYWSD